MNNRSAPDNDFGETCLMLAHCQLSMTWKGCPNRTPSACNRACPRNQCMQYELALEHLIETAFSVGFAKTKRMTRYENVA